MLVRHQQRSQAVLGQLVGRAGGNLLAGRSDNVAGLGVNQVTRRLGPAPAFLQIGNGPALLGRLVLDGSVEGAEDFFLVQAQRIEQRRRRQLAAAIETHVDHVLGVELEVQPGTAIRDDAGSEQVFARCMGLAAVVVEEHARRTVHLGYNDALGAIDDEGALVGHERDIAHVDVLLLDVLDRTCAGFLVHIKDDQAHLHLQRSGIRHVALLAFLDVELRRFELVGDEIQNGALGEILDREDRLEDGLHARVATRARGHILHQEVLVRTLLNFDEIRHRNRFRNATERLANPLLAGERQTHVGSLRRQHCAM